MTSNITQYRYSRLLDEIPVNDSTLFILIASIKEVKITKNKHGEILNEKIKSGPSHSIESMDSFESIDSYDDLRVSYELTEQEFDELTHLHQTNKEKFICYKRG